MLKIPKVGCFLSNFKFITEINQNKQLEVCIVYEKKNKHGVIEHKMQNYLIVVDKRWPNIQIIKKTIDTHLSSAKNHSKVVIQPFQYRFYINFNNDQFSGKMVL